eukprot:scaffold34765_cov13-Tisochrysis_lutea.AAC.1
MQLPTFQVKWDKVSSTCHPQASRKWKAARDAGHLLSSTQAPCSLSRFLLHGGHGGKEMAALYA